MLEPATNDAQLVRGIIYVNFNERIPDRVINVNHYPAKFKERQHLGQLCQHIHYPVSSFGNVISAHEENSEGGRSKQRKRIRDFF